MRAALLLAALLGCRGDSGVDSAVDPLCDEVEGPVTWDNFGRSFTTEHCQSCHASTTLDRHDAPKTVVFDTEEDALALADRILERASGDKATMPPQGGVTEEDRLLLTVWLSCE